MKYLHLLFLILIFAACTDKKPEINSAFELTDDMGNIIKFESFPERVITLAPSLTEMIYELEVEDKLVGNTNYCNYPGAANNVEKIGDLLTVNFEKIVSLKPDLIIISVEGNNKSTYDKLIQLGMKVFISNPRNYEGIKNTFYNMGKIFNKTDRVEKIKKNWDERVNAVKSNIADTQFEIMFLVALKPIMLAGDNTFINEFIEFSNCKNIAEGIKINYPIFNREEVIKIDPEFIFYAAKEKEVAKEIKTAYAEWKDLSAIKNDNIIIVDPDLFLRPGPRFVDALEVFSKSIRSH